MKWAIEPSHPNEWGSGLQVKERYNINIEQKEWETNREKRTRTEETQDLAKNTKQDQEEMAGGDIRTAGDGDKTIVLEKGP